MKPSEIGLISRQHQRNIDVRQRLARDGGRNVLGQQAEHGALVAGPALELCHGCLDVESASGTVVDALVSTQIEPRVDRLERDRRRERAQGLSRALGVEAPPWPHHRARARLLGEASLQLVEAAALADGQRARQRSLGFCRVELEPEIGPADRKQPVFELQVASALEQLGPARLQPGAELAAGRRDALLERDGVQAGRAGGKHTRTGRSDGQRRHRTDHGEPPHSSSQKAADGHITVQPWPRAAAGAKTTYTSPMTADAPPRLYDDLARWWPLFSGPADYDEEAPEVLSLLRGAASEPAKTVLELGCGGGSLGSHLKRHFELTLSDLSPRMLEVSRALNPECEHVAGDMRTVSLNRQFDRVLIHDAIMYLTEPDAVRAALANAARHCRSGGAVVLLPDCVSESFEPGTEQGGSDGDDGRGLRWLEWSFDPDPRDTTFITAYSLVFRDPDGALHGELDRHELGLFPRAAWLEWLREAGLSPGLRSDPWRADLFVGSKP
jgi:SAM-dependent methyltransferase